MHSVTTKTVDRGIARARLLAAARADIARLEPAQSAGWDVAAELDRARRAVALLGASS